MTDNPNQHVAREGEQSNLHSAITAQDWEDFGAVVGGQQGPAVQTAEFPAMPANYPEMRNRQAADFQRVFAEGQAGVQPMPAADYQAILLREFDMIATGGRVNTRPGTINGRFATLLDNLGLPDAERALYTQRLQAMTARMQQGQMSRAEYLGVISQLGGIQANFEYGQNPNAAAITLMQTQLRALLAAPQQPRN